MDSQRFSRRQFLATAAAASVKSAKPQDRPNIVFLMSDEHRADAMGCAGNHAVHTPNLDRLAARGVRFARTYCQGPLCQPSRASLMTGQYVHQHRQTWNDLEMNPAWPTMMRQLQRAGYYTAKFGKAHLTRSGYTPESKLDWSRSFGFDHILEEYDRSVHVRPGVMTPFMAYLKGLNLLETYQSEIPSSRSPGVRRTDMYKGFVSKIPQEHNPAAFLAGRAIEFLRAYKRDKPLYLEVSFVDPHPPLIDDSRWAAQYEGAKVPLAPFDPPPQPNNAWGNYLRRWIQATGTATLTPEAVARATRHYYGKISLVDQKIGDIVNAIHDLGLGDNTWIFYTADHGDMMGDHKLMYKNVFYQGSVQVPNIVQPPGGMTGRTVEGPVESIDITATVLDAAGVELPSAKGRSLMPFTKGQGVAREVAHSELAGLNNKGNFLVMAATARYRYTYDWENKLACELFDLEKDPGESHNLVEEPGSAGIRNDMHKDYLLPFMEDKKGSGV
jgi:arylsulfatase A-like enzyme